MKNEVSKNRYSSVNPFATLNGGVGAVDLSEAWNDKKRLDALRTRHYKELLYTLKKSLENHSSLLPPALIGFLSAERDSNTMRNPINFETCGTFSEGKYQNLLDVLWSNMCEPYLYEGILSPYTVKLISKEYYRVLRKCQELDRTDFEFKCHYPQRFQSSIPNPFQKSTSQKD